MLPCLLLLLSFAVLLVSAKLLVNGASGLAHHYHWPPLFAGFVLVAAGTSLPEIMIAVQASLDGISDLGLSNAIGSGIANIGLVIGVLALIRPLSMQSSFLTREFPLLFIAMLFTWTLVLDGFLGVVDSCLSLLVCLAFIAWLLYTSRPSLMQRKTNEQFQRIYFQKRGVKHYAFSLGLGLVLVPLSSSFLVRQSSLLADMFGISQEITGLTLVAFGSSVPELITAFLAIRQQADDIAIGTVLGSNVFNLLAVLIFPGIIHPDYVSSAVLWRDMPVMFFITGFLLWINTTRDKKITRWHGGLFILIYSCYIFSLIFTVCC